MKRVRHKDNKLLIFLYDKYNRGEITPDYQKLSIKMQRACSIMRSLSFECGKYSGCNDHEELNYVL